MAVPDPSKRPQHREWIWDDAHSRENRDCANFLMDWENACLEDFLGATTGVRLMHARCNKDKWPWRNQRHLVEPWAEFMKNEVYPNHSDVDWEEYTLWVSSGGGDDMFQSPGHQGALEDALETGTLGNGVGNDERVSIVMGCMVIIYVLSFSCTYVIDLLIIFNTMVR